MLERRFGTADVKEIGESLAPELRGLWGAGFLRLFAANEFVYRHRSPGLLMETNGTLLGNPGDDEDCCESCEVLFRFDILRRLRLRSADVRPLGRRRITIVNGNGSTSRR